MPLTHPAAAEPNAVLTINSRHGLGGFSSHWLALFFARALGTTGATFGGYAEQTLHVRLGGETGLDLATRELRSRAHRLGEHEVMIELADDTLAVLHELRGRARAGIRAQVYAPDPPQARRAVERIAAVFAPYRDEPPLTFEVTWHFRSGNGQLQSADICESADAHLVDAAYPTIPGGVHAFIRRYLAAPDTILMLQGPPGTGKTQLIRAIAGEMSRLRERAASVFFSNDERVLNTDEFFVRFATGESDLLVLEDADHALLARSRGNAEMHRILGVSDGILRLQQRKIIFSTNLPNVQDIDDALLRPGRCFARVQLRALTPDEAHRLLVSICADATHADRARHALPAGARSVTVAETYQAMRTTESDPLAINRAAA